MKRPTLTCLAFMTTIAIGALSSGCGADVQRGDRDDQFDEEDDEEEEEVVLPSHVSVTVHGAMVRPWDADHELWDDSQKVTPEELADLADALGAPVPYVAVGEFLADTFLDHWAPPDPFGHAHLMIDGEWQARKTLATPDNNIDNTLTPSFSSTWPAVSLDGARLRVTLVDEDDFLSGDDDPIGTVVIHEDDLIDAYLNGGNTPIAVDDQGDGTILFVNLSVADGATSG